MALNRGWLKRKLWLLRLIGIPGPVLQAHYLPACLRPNICWHKEPQAAIGVLQAIVKLSGQAHQDLIARRITLNSCWHKEP